MRRNGFHKLLTMWIRQCSEARSHRRYIGTKERIAAVTAHIRPDGADSSSVAVLIARSSSEVDEGLRSGSLFSQNFIHYFSLRQLID